MTGAQALHLAIRRLTEAGIECAAGDARKLVAHAMGIGADRLTLHLPDTIIPAQQVRLDAALAARAARQPLSQIVGARMFYGRRFRVTRDVLDPRPETETLVAAALSQPFRRVLDLGTGSGAILLTLLAERPEATGVGVDISAAALEIARENAKLLGIGAAGFGLSDWCAAVTGMFDLIVSNPPYIAASEMAALAPEVRLWEPALALTPGGDGLDAYRAIAAQAPAHLAPGGRLLLEIGPSQAAAVCALLRNAGLGATDVLQDLDRRDRVVVARHG